jgi:hypothetical protein
VSVLDQIRGRRDVTVEQVLLALDLVPGSDTEDRHRLLGIASRALGDPRVVARWLELAGAETDDSLRAAMLRRLLALEPSQVPDLDAYVSVLIAAAAPESTRSLAIAALDRMGSVDPLVHAFHRERLHDVQRLILFALARHDDPPPAVVDIFDAALDACDEDLKPFLLDRLLRAGALDHDRLAPLLRPSEPVAVRLRVLDHLVDHAVPVDLRDVVASDPDPRCRRAAVRLLAASGSGAETVIDALRHDPDEMVRAAAAAAVEAAVDLTPATIEALAAAIHEERATELAVFILRLLQPHVGRSPVVRASLFELLQRNIDADLAILVWRTLAPLVASDDDARGLFTAAFERVGHDRVRGAILEALAGVADPHDQLVGLYHAALASPDGRIRSWGMRGLRLVSMDETGTAHVAAASGLLLDPEVDGHVRLDLARKIARIPDKSPALLADLARIAEQGEGELRDVCRKAHDQAVSDLGAGSIDWDGWYRRVEVESEVEGIFPGVFLGYDANPPAARRILRAALAPGCSNALYSSGVKPSQILDFLAAKHAIDDDVSRYCVSSILGQNASYGSPNHHLALLKANLAFPALKDSLWQILDRRTDVDPVLLRELLLLAHDGEAEVAAILAERLRTRTNPKQALPLLTFLAGNAAWEPAEALLLGVPPALLDDPNRRVLDEAYRRLKREPPRSTPGGPGLADD